MARLKLRQLNSLDELRNHSAAWDDLWWRADVCLPTLRAETLAQWVEQFAPSQRFVATIVEQDGNFIAALPLVQARKGGILKVGTLPSNEWSNGGDLLLDREAVNGHVVEKLIQGIKQIGWPLLWLIEVPSESDRWTLFRQAYEEDGHTISTPLMYQIGVVDIDGDWEGYQAAWSSNHRHAVRKSLRKLQELGDVQLKRHHEFAADELESLLRVALEIEDQSWKGEAGTSILQTPGMDKYFVRQARQLSQWGQLELLFLEVDGNPIAFEYCYNAKGVCFSQKIGYDPEFRKFGPGRLLRCMQLEEYFADPEQRILDTLGILCESKAKWCNRSYSLTRLITDTGGLLGKSAVKAYTNLWPTIRRLRGKEEALEIPKLGAVKNAASASKQGAAVQLV